MTQFPKTRAEQFSLAIDPATRHLAMPAPGVDPEFDEIWEALGPPVVAPVIETKWTPDRGEVDGEGAE